MIKFDALTVENKDIVETRLVCPCCHMGFIKTGDEMSNKFVYPSDRVRFALPMDYPTCNKCNTKFEIVIDRTLKIAMRKIKY